MLHEREALNLSWPDRFFPFLSVFGKSGLHETIVTNQHKHLIVNRRVMLLYKLFVDIMYLKITYNL